MNLDLLKVLQRLVGFFKFCLVTYFYLARSEYERLRVRLITSNNKIAQLKEKISQIRPNSLYEEVDDGRFFDLIFYIF